MLTPILDHSSKQPLYEQIYHHIRGEMEAGRLRAGERLPSKRALAAHLKVGVITVEGAYSQLLAEGYLRSEPKRGFFVQPLEALPTSPPACRPIPSAAELAVSPPFQYDFSTSRVDTGLFPFATWAKLMREVLSAREAALLSSTHPQGSPELRRAIAEHLYRFRGIQADSEQVVVGAGSEYLIGLLVQLLGREGGYGVENPGYTKPARIFASNGAQVVPLPLDGQGLRVDALEAAPVRVAHVTPAHHFPMGIIMPVTRRKALLAWAMECRERYIIEDDYDSEYRFSGRPIPALQSLDGGERVIYLNTFAKSLAPSLRISYMVLPPHLLERYRRELRFYSSTVPAFEQYALALFMERGHFERHLSRTRIRYKARREALLAAAKETGLLKVGAFSGGDAGLHLLLRLHDCRSEAELAALAAKAGVGVAPLDGCYLTPPPPNQDPCLILGYTRTPPEAMEPALRRLKSVWNF
ncbi:PLP-dependent aminotransferase family protein [Lawsonibacter celer]|uniref:MocR-like pyridoxine biosynthesis transcription factor PdxR n=1 Tax=Lawsonibacter celer TaxID=2986526 RepID=UPI001647FC94|nr:PLP-dependent aminotransferase family protein [Lawsonibacter celer]